MAQLGSKQNLSWPTSDSLTESWQRSLGETKIKGNKIHDDLFDHNATEFTVDDAVSMIREGCGARKLGQINIFGANSVNQLANVLVPEAQNLSSQSFSVIVLYACTFLVAVIPDQSAMLIDSHSHGSRGPS